IGERVDAGAFDGATHLAYVSTGDGKIFVFHQDSPDAYSLVQEIATHPGSKTMGYDPKTRNIIVPSSDNGAMQVLVFSAKPCCTRCSLVLRWPCVFARLECPEPGWRNGRR